jgi:outer membrane protein OmpA-like peptidoglycan-associated protein
MKIYKLAENTISNDDYKLLIKFLQNRKTLTQSKIVNNFQKNFSDFLKTKYSIFVNSGSSANLLIAQVLIEGHTDNTGSAAQNNLLSLQRANAIGDYLQQKGIAANRIQRKGLGATTPIADNNTAAGRAKNRRTSFTITLK